MIDDALPISNTNCSLFVSDRIMEARFELIRLGLLSGLLKSLHSRINFTILVATN